MKIKTVCSTCNKEFIREMYKAEFNRNPPKYCSRKCVRAPHLTELNNKNNQLNGFLYADKIRETHLKKNEDTATYYRKFHGRHEHRVVMEKILGRELKSDEYVHHIDENKRNNDPFNLRLMTPEEHTRLHFKGKRRRKK